MQEQQPKRRPGRPRQGQARRERIEITLAPETIAFLDAQPTPRSQFIEDLILCSQPYQSWQDTRLSS